MSEPISDAEIDELLAGITPGKWERDPYDEPTMQVIAVGNEVVAYHNQHIRQNDDRVVPNFKFIAAAPALITQLRGERDTAQAITKRWKAAVEGLTPSGSEYVDDPEACTAAEKLVARSVPAPDTSVQDEARAILMLLHNPSMNTPDYVEVENAIATALQSHGDARFNEGVRVGASWASVYAVGIESQNDVEGQVENWTDFHRGQVYAAKELAITIKERFQVNEEVQP